MSGMSPLVSVLVGVALIGLSAFFVAIEFALVAARRYRLEEVAGTSAAARAALRSSRDLSLLLAGSQLGITLCVVGLGATAKPAVHDAFMPVFTGWGLPEATADVVAFLVALIIVTFLHLVVGEMAPKSWAIAHPERSAILLALPMRAFLRLTRPLLVVLNGIANWCLCRVGVDPVDEVASGHSPDTLRELVDHSAEVGMLDPQRRDQLLTVIDLDNTPIRDLVQPVAQISGVAASATADQIRDVAAHGGHLRLVVWDDADRPTGVVHVRDALDAAPAATAGDLARPILTLPADNTIHTALTTLRHRRSQFALVTDANQLHGLITMQDLLDRVLPSDRSVSEERP